MKKDKFKKNKLYYLPEDDAKIRFMEQLVDGAYVFRYYKHEEFYEYETKDGSEVWECKKNYLKENPEKI